MELVQCTTADGVRLDGVWSLAPRTGKWEFDAVLMLHGVTGNFYSTAFFNAAVKNLTAAGVSVLRANNRGHDVINRVAAFDGPKFIGAAFEKIVDANHDLQAWVDFAENRGARRVAVWGHSLGAVKAILYAESVNDERVACVVASSPPRFSYEEFRKDPVEWPIFKASYDEAKALVDEGKPDALLQVSKPTSLIISARTFIEKYGPSGGFDYTIAISHIRIPLLLTLGSMEGTEAKPGFSRIALFGSDSYLKDIARKNPHMRYVRVDGADHWYAGREDELCDMVSRFFQEVPRRLAGG
jgi:pimeloyl-ACP methyl ester carboxylesterase